MGLFDLIGFAADKAYNKYKESKLENAMDAILDSLDSTAINIEVLPYVEGQDKNNIKGKVYRLSKDDMIKSSATYFLTTSDWLLKTGIDINNDNAYEAALHEKGGYLYLNLVKRYTSVAQNYKAKYSSNPAFTALFLYIPEEKVMMAMPKFIKDPKTGNAALAKKAGYEEFGKIEKIKAETPERFEALLPNFYFRAKAFAHRVAEELNSYDKNDLGNAFKKFQEKHGSENEIEYVL
ncbi:MAG: hypothetical protein M1322_02540 [Candidatus Parvarchaeota archaeon]|jgi:hypothetical protein|nr:hypothetical protein [Candidatus Parvarchaeota archaeon]MCL5106967.1 hypothetical protein [Candidatus Parvarchaeota archaeon]